MTNKKFCILKKTIANILIGFLFLFFQTNSVVSQTKLPIDTIAKPLSWNVSIGSSVMGGFNGSPLFSTFIAPQLNYKLTDKWSVGGGLIVRNYSLGGARTLSNEQTTTSLPQNITQSLFFVHGSYQATNRLMINATVYKSFDSGGFLGYQNQVNAFNQNFKGIMVDVNYKITEHSYISIGLDYSDGANNPFLNRSYNNSSFMGNGFNGVFR